MGGWRQICGGGVEERRKMHIKRKVASGEKNYEQYTSEAGWRAQGESIVNSTARRLQSKCGRR